MDLNNKVIVLTGGKRGIGKAILEKLANEGATVAFCSQSSENVEKALENVVGVNPSAEIYYQKVDVRISHEVKEFINNVVEKYQKIDVLINNAGAVRSSLMEHVTEDDWNIQLDTNIKGPYLMMKEVIPVMRKNGRGHIVNISSFAGKVAFPGLSAYCASKFGLIGLSLSVKEEIRKDNIQLTVVNPGAVDTDIWQHIQGEYNHDKMVTAEDVANSVLFAIKNSDTCTIDEIQVTPKSGRV